RGSTLSRRVPLRSHEAYPLQSARAGTVGSGVGRAKEALFGSLHIPRARRSKSAAAAGLWPADGQGRGGEGGEDSHNARACVPLLLAGWTRRGHATGRCVSTWSGQLLKAETSSILISRREA
ncbi:unnamed protein product, partial [Ectocarpus fasciculatus]